MIFDKFTAEVSVFLITIPTPGRPDLPTISMLCDFPDTLTPPSQTILPLSINKRPEVAYMTRSIYPHVVNWQ